MTTTNPFDEARVHRAGYRDITPEATYEGRSRVRLVDVRETHELATDGFIEGIEHVPLATLEGKARDWNRDQDIVLICRSGARSGRAAEAMVRMGFHRVMNMVGGMIAYTAAKLPVARS